MGKAVLELAVDGTLEAILSGKPSVTSLTSERVPALLWMNRTFSCPFEGCLGYIGYSGQDIGLHEDSGTVVVTAGLCGMANPYFSPLIGRELKHLGEVEARLHRRSCEAPKAQILGSLTVHDFGVVTW